MKLKTDQTNKVTIRFLILEFSLKLNFFFEELFNGNLISNSIKKIREKCWNINRAFEGGKTSDSERDVITMILLYYIFQNLIKQIDSLSVKLN